MPKYLSNIDMSQNEIQNVVIHATAEAPSNPKVGQIYTDISGEDPQIVWWTGKEWLPLGKVSVPENMPSAINPSLSISLLSIGSGGLVEVGSTFPVSYEATFNPGSYTYGPETGISVKSWKVYDNSGSGISLTESSGTFEDIMFKDGTEYTITAEATHTEGAIPVTDLGNPAPAIQIKEGTLSASVSTSSDSITGFRKYFYGSPASIIEMNSEGIRSSLTHSTAPVESGTTFELPIAKGANQVIIAFPSNSGLYLSSVIDKGAFNIDVYDIFQKSVVAVEGANGYEAISYDVYTYTPDISLNKNTYIVTIS